MRRALAPITLALAVAAGAGSAQAAFFGPTPYLAATGSPFAGKPVADYFHLDDYQTDTRTPGYTSNTTQILPPAGLTDSVDLDDGVVDGSGDAGRSLYSASLRTIVFTFDAGTLGRLPTHAGVVWTDVGWTDGVTGFGDVIFEAFDGLGVSLGSVLASNLGDGNAGGGTAEDRFFGVRSFAGVGRIEISMPKSIDWEVDHLQYGVLTPIPAALPLLASALGGLGWLARRRRKAA